MALIIEDGTIVANANSFATVAECQAYADARGLTLPTTDAGIEVLLVSAFDFLFSIEADFQGTRYNTDQEAPFPRDEIYFLRDPDNDISGTIPKVLKNGQCRLAFDASQSDLLATGSGRVVKKEGVGPLSVEYGDDGASNPQVKPTAALAILEPLFKYSSTVGVYVVR